MSDTTSTTPLNEVTVTVRLRTEGDAEGLAQKIAEYLANPYEGDYGLNIWCGLVDDPPAPLEVLVTLPDGTTQEYVGGKKWDR